MRTSLIWLLKRKDALVWESGGIASILRSTIEKNPRAGEVQKHETCRKEATIKECPPYQASIRILTPSIEKNIIDGDKWQLVALSRKCTGKLLNERNFVSNPHGES
jgi:hypothetical protein